MKNICDHLINILAECDNPHQSTWLKILIIYLLTYFLCLKKYFKAYFTLERINCGKYFVYVALYPYCITASFGRYNNERGNETFLKNLSKLVHTFRSCALLIANHLERETPNTVRYKLYEDRVT